MENLTITQNNKSGDNLVNSKKQVNKYRAQGFMVGVIATVITKIIGFYIYQWISNYL